MAIIGIPSGMEPPDRCAVLDHIGQPSADQNGQSLFHDLPTVTLVTRIGV